MNRKKFTKALIKETGKIKDHEINMFRDFMPLNEMSKDYLSAEQKSLKEYVADLLTYNKELKEKYYIFHLSKTIDTKWKPIDLDKIVNHFYKNSDSIKRIYESTGR